VSQSFILGRNEKVEQRIKKKIIYFELQTDGYLSVSQSFILGRNEKVEQHIKKKICKPNVLRFWVEGGVIPLCDLVQLSFL